MPLDDIHNWFDSKNWNPHDFQKETWNAISQGKSGLLNAPTGSGKTYAVLAPFMEQALKNKDKGIQLLWICPIRALTQEISIASRRMAEGIGLEWDIAIRNGDTSQKERARIQKELPEMLITTPESLHLLLSHKNASRYFKHLKGIVVDEWHELIGSKRGVLQELANSRLLNYAPEVSIWGISATIGNLEEARDNLLFPIKKESDTDLVLIRSDIKKEIKVIPVIPEEADELPWSGHLGIKLAKQIVPVIEGSSSTLIFTNTRNQAEMWYRELLEIHPEWAGNMALHHGSMDKKTRGWVENALHEGDLKLVVCTSSLDLGVDFRPVETIIQIGGPKGVSRFIQRAGRSGHQPGALSTIYFLPTHSLELIESLALKTAIRSKFLESRNPMTRSFDVLVQYLMTLAIGEGFDAENVLKQIKNTWAFNEITEEEWSWCLSFIRYGGDALKAYDDFRRAEVIDGIYKITSRKQAMRHRMNIGVIVNDSVMHVKYVSGKKIGTIEEWFVSKLKVGDKFWFSGRNLEVKSIKDMEVRVRSTKSKEGKVPAWMGGRLPLSSKMSHLFRGELTFFQQKPKEQEPEYNVLSQVLNQQKVKSFLPNEKELLIETLISREGHHVFVYPFEGRFVHEAIASLLAYRISLLTPLSVSMAFNDYGFELLSDQPIPVEDAIEQNFFTTDFLYDDLLSSINAAEMGSRRFRDIAAISGLVFQGFPGKMKKTRHLQASSKLFYEVFEDVDPNNLLLKQSLEEVLEYQLEYPRLHDTLERIQNQEIVLKAIEKPTPFSFPIMVDRLRERLSSEKLEDRIKKMQIQATK